MAVPEPLPQDQERPRLAPAGQEDPPPYPLSRNIKDKCGRIGGADRQCPGRGAAGPRGLGEIFRATLIPHIELSAAFFHVITAVIGTTITPYMFFWQTSQEVEENAGRAAWA